MKNILLLLVIILLSACAGTHFDWSTARSIKVGMTTSELQLLMGPPYMVTSNAQGTIWVWSYADTFSGAKSVSVVVDKTNKVVSTPVIPDSFQ